VRFVIVLTLPSASLPNQSKREANMVARLRHTALLLVLVVALPLDLLAQSLQRARPEDVGMSSERLQRLSTVFKKYVEQQQLAGGVVMIAREGKVVYAQAFGERDRESHATMQEDAVFRIASQTKALVSVATMILQEDGALLIGDPVGKYLPEFQKTQVAVARDSGRYSVVDARRPITIRDLLTHTAGIGYGSGVAADQWATAHIQGWYFADRDEPIGATVARLARLPMDAQPGERWIYGYSIDILGALVERVSGMSLEAFLRTRITEPLRMKDTRFYLPTSARDRLATVYSARESGGLERAPDAGTMTSQGAYVDGPRKSFSGGAGLLSTANDYLRFLQMLANGGELDGVRVLSPKSVELMTVDHVGEKYGTPGVGFGLGFSVVTNLGLRGQPGSLGEYGWGGAYHSAYWVDPKEKLVVVYFTQLIPARTLDDQAKLRALVYQAITR
jgi:CubicO group peptidase (beta-lactamase class C family)